MTGSHSAMLSRPRPACGPSWWSGGLPQLAKRVRSVSPCAGLASHCQSASIVQERAGSPSLSQSSAKFTRSTSDMPGTFRVLAVWAPDVQPYQSAGQAGAPSCRFPPQRPGPFLVQDAHGEQGKYGNQRDKRCAKHDNQEEKAHPNALTVVVAGPDQGSPSWGDPSRDWHGHQADPKGTVTGPGRYSASGRKLPRASICLCAITSWRPQ